VAIDNDAKACQKAFSNACAFIGTRDLIQEHIAYRVWPLVDNWEMLKETVAGSSEGGLIRLKYTFRYRDRFDEPNDDWLKCIEATSDKLLGAYTRAKADALSSTFGDRGKKRLNRVFDAIGFIYPDYCYPLRRQGKKRKTAASAISAVPKGKKIKVLTHRPRYIETPVVPEFGEGTSSAAEAEQAAPIVRSTEGSTVVPKVPIVGSAEAKDDVAEEPELEKIIVLPKSPPAQAELPKVTKAPATTPKRRRMASVLDAIMATTKELSPAPAKKVAKAATAQAEAETRSSVPTETKPAATEDKAKQESPNTGMAAEWDVMEKAESLAPEAPSKDIDYIIRHALGKRLSEEEILEAKHYARELKYLKGALVFNGMDEADFLYCLPDNKEISVCREMVKSMGFPKLEAGLSAMSKDDLADSLAYNSMKVQKLESRLEGGGVNRQI
jgi:hypothetical protein